MRVPVVKVTMPVAPPPSMNAPEHVTPADMTDIVPPSVIVTAAAVIVLALHVNTPVFAMLVLPVTVRFLLVAASLSKVVNVPAVTVKLLSTPSE